MRKTILLTLLFSIFSLGVIHNSHGEFSKFLETAETQEVGEEREVEELLIQSSGLLVASGNSTGKVLFTISTGEVELVPLEVVTPPPSWSRLK